MSEYKACRRCGASLGPDDNFCMVCGAPTSEEPPVAKGSRSDASVDQASQAAPEAATFTPEALDVMIASEPAIQSDGPFAFQGSMGTDTLREAMASSASSGLSTASGDLTPGLPEILSSGVDTPDARGERENEVSPRQIVFSGADVDTPDGFTSPSTASGTSDILSDAGVSDTIDITGTDVVPAAPVPSEGEAVVKGASDVAGQAATTSAVALASGAPAASAESQWLTEALDTDLGPTPSGSVSTVSDMPAAPADVPAGSIPASATDATDVPVASVDSAIPYVSAVKSYVDVPASDAGASVMPTDSRPTDDSPMLETSDTPGVGASGARKSSRRKVAAGVVAVLLIILAVLGFLLYKHSRDEAARSAIVVTAQSMVACDKSLQELDDVAELNYSYLILDKTDAVRDGLSDASSSLEDARKSLESARSDGWALGDNERRTLDVLQDGLDARAGMIDSGGQLVSLLADVRSASDELARLVTDSSLFLGSSDNIVNVLNSSPRYIDQIDSSSMVNDLENAKKYQSSMSNDLKAAREKLPTANLSKYQMAIDRASTMATALQGMVDAIRTQDAARANDAATALNTAIESFNDARRELPPLAESVESLVPDSAKDYVESYRAQRERTVETLRELGGNSLTRDIVGGSMLLQGSKV